MESFVTIVASKALEISHCKQLKDSSSLRIDISLTDHLEIII